MARGVILYIVLVITLAAVAIASINQGSSEKLSPKDRITEDQIHIYSDRIVIDIEEASWATYADTNSMDPLLDIGANGIEIIPKSENDLHIGDIAAYQSKSSQELIVHRIVEIKEDEQGKYFIFKGDNNKTEDIEKVRFNQIKYVLIGIIY